VLKLFLQGLVLLTIAFRFLALFTHLRRAWQSDARPGDGLAAEFRRELQRRGLLIVLPFPQAD